MFKANIIIINFFYYEKIKLKNLKFEAKDLLQRNQLKTVFGGSDSPECYCKNSNTGGARFNNIDNCDNCESWCDQNYPGWSSWICTGPLGGGGYGY